MINIINYYYNLYPIEIKKYDDYYLFKVSNTFYMLYIIYDEPKYLDKIISLLNNSNFKYHLIIFNKDNSIYTDYEEKKYVLLKLREEPQKIISLNSIIYLNLEGENDWYKLWSNRIDYYEQQLEEVVEDNSIKFGIQYYIGLTEIAIAYLNKIHEQYNKTNNNYSIQHLKIKSPTLAIDFLNPLEMTIDVKIRDIAEYIKSSFFNNDFNYQSLAYLDNLILNDYLANMLMARLLYPSYFFTHYDKYIESREIDNQIFMIMKKSKDYETLLKKIYATLSEKYKLIKINLLL